MPRQTRLLINTLEIAVEEVVKRITLEVTSNLIETTPVDTGWARSNWVPRIGESFTGTAGARDGDNVTLNLGLQQQGLATVAAQYTIQRGAVYITNNVPYIVFLNEGSSQQAPRAFVQTAIARGIQQIGRTRDLT